jgi:hypothetical protein
LDRPLTKASTWLAGKHWRRMFRIVASSPEPIAKVAAVAEAEVSDTVPVLADMAQVPPASGQAETMPVPDAVAPDQLDRDIAEIIAIRDQLLAEPIALAPPYGAAEPPGPSRTADRVPILVGGALAFTMLVVFGAAASLVSLR